MKKLINSILTAVMLVSLTTMTGCGEKEINPADYVNITYTGVNGKGKANVTFDVLGFSDDLVANAPEKKQDALTRELMTMKLDDLVTYETDKETELSNGDTITVTLDWDDTPIKKDYKLKFAGDNTVSVTVEDLPEVIELDAFDPEIFNVDMNHKGVHITVTGTSPQLEVRIQNDISRDDPRSKLIYSTEYQNGYANGDEVIVSVSSYELQNDLYALKEEKGSFVIEGFDEYISSKDQLTNDNLAIIEKEFKDALAAVLGDGSWNAEGNNIFYVYAIQNSKAQQIDCHWDKAYLLTLKKGISTESYYGDFNRLVIPISIDAYGMTDRYGYRKDVQDFTGLVGGFIGDNLIVDPEMKMVFSPDQISRTLENVDKYDMDGFVDAYVNKYADKYDIFEIDISSWNE